MLTTLTEGLKQLVFPDNCLVCRTFLNSNHTRQLCPGCLNALTFNTPPFCAACSRHLDHFSEDSICMSCRDHERHLNKAWAACAYTQEMRGLLHMFKYNGKSALHKTFVPLMTGFIDTYHVPLAQFDFVAPIPLHPAKLRERGFNQAEILSKNLCAHYALNHAPALLLRTHHTHTQALLDRKQRWTNLNGAFKIHPSAKVEERAVLLVDDLLTTGATADAAAAALKEAGAAYVGVLALAITE